MAKKKKSLAKHLRKKRKQKTLGTNVPDLPTIPPMPMPLIPQVMTDRIVEKLKQMDPEQLKEVQKKMWGMNGSDDHE